MTNIKLSVSLRRAIFGFVCLLIIVTSAVGCTSNPPEIENKLEPVEVVDMDALKKDAEILGMQYVSCLNKNTAQLDDKISDALTIARATNSRCIHFFSAMMDVKKKISCGNDIHCAIGYSKGVDDFIEKINNQPTLALKVVLKSRNKD